MRPPGRPRARARSLAAVGLLLLGAAVLGACGGAGSGPGSGSGSPSPGDDGSDAGAGSGPSSTAGAWRGCDRSAFADAEPLASGSMRSGDRVALFGPDAGPCADALVVASATGTRGVDLAGVDLDPETLAEVDLGAPAVLRVDSAGHPRGGYQPHLFLLTDDALTEVTVGDAPLLPFVATDGGAAPAAAVCGDGAIELQQARTSEPPGVMLAWDVSATRYELTAARLSAEPVEVLATDVPDPLLGERFPEVATGSVLEGCTRPLG